MHALVGLAYGLLGAVTAIVTSSIVFTTRGEQFDTTSSVVARALVGVILATPLFAIIGTAIGSLTENSSAAMAGLLVWVLVIEPPTVLGLPDLGQWLPSAAGLALTYSPDVELLSRATGGIVLGIYAAAAFWLSLQRIRLADV